MNHYFIWGMGFLGTSLAYDLKNMGFKVSGCVRNPENLEYLISVGFKDVCLAEPSPQLAEFLEQADMILLGVPVNVTREVFTLLQKSNLKAEVVITDMGSTKSEVMRLATEEFPLLRFTGSHPMAGSELSGPKHAKAGLFTGATVYLTPGLYAMVDKAVSQFWLNLHCQVVTLSAKDHDRQLAYLSHGLHLLSCAVVHLLKDIPEVLNCNYPPAAGSFRDISRVATSNPALWHSILESNREEVVNYLEQLENLIAKWKSALRSGSLDIEQIFTEAAQLRQRIVKN